MAPIVNSKTLSLEGTTLDSATEGESDDSGDHLSFYLERSKVHFAEVIQIYDILNFDDYSDRELRRSWYTVEDKDKMSEKHNKIFQRFEAGKKCKSNMSYRGLDCWTAAGSAKLDEIIAKVVDAVMNEQDKQWASGMDDWQRIADVACAVTEGSKIRAREIALEDQCEAQAAFEDDDTGVVSASEDSFSMRSSKSLLISPKGRRKKKITHCDNNKTKRDKERKTKRRESGRKSRSSKRSSRKSKPDLVESIDPPGFLQSPVSVVE